MSPTPPPPQEQAHYARAVLAAEAEAIQRIEIGPSFAQAVNLILQRTAAAPHEGSRFNSSAAQGSLVVSGLGKSGLIGRKLSATFASTGTPSHFLHATEALHGDLGRVRRGDAVLLLSYTGSTEEVVALAERLAQDGVAMVGIVARIDSDLARLATRAGGVGLAVGEVAEAGPHNLAPTASTAAMLAMGDALALAVSRGRGFSCDQFARMHPAGGLGRQLMPVTEAMRFRVGESEPGGGRGPSRGTRAVPEPSPTHPPGASMPRPHRNRATWP